MTDPQPFILQAGAQAKRHAPATARNRDAITEMLADVLPIGTILEIASGTGEHIVHFAAAFRQAIWQPSDHDALGLESIRAWSAEAGLANLMPPVLIDASLPDWPVPEVDAILCINMVHIAPWAATIGLMAGAARHLPKSGPLILYGPFIVPGMETAPSNVSFDANLKTQNPDWGLRDLNELEALAKSHGLSLDRVIEMPANNLSVIFRRD